MPAMNQQEINKLLDNGNKLVRIPYVGSDYIEIDLLDGRIIEVEFGTMYEERVPFAEGKIKNKE